MTVVALVNDATPVPYTAILELIGMLAFAAIVLVEVEVEKYPPPVDIADDPVAPVKPAGPVAPVGPVTLFPPVAPVMPSLWFLSVLSRPIVLLGSVAPCYTGYLQALGIPCIPLWTRYPLLDLSPRPTCMLSSGTLTLFVCLVDLVAPVAPKLLPPDLLRLCGPFEPLEDLVDPLLQLDSSCSRCSGWSCLIRLSLRIPCGPGGASWPY